MTAIESRPAMVRMGVCIQDALAREATASHNDDLSENAVRPFTVPSIRWLRNLPSASKRAPNARDMNGRPPPPPPALQHSLVISAHALTRIPTHAERMRVVRDLWSRVEVGGALVLVEPGTPVGSAFVRQAREQILREEVKRQVCTSLVRASHNFSDSASSSHLHSNGWHVLYSPDCLFHDVAQVFGAQQHTTMCLKKRKVIKEKAEKNTTVCCCAAAQMCSDDSSNRLMIGVGCRHR
jgi:hypothetical protein